MTRNNLRILCYHGFALADEAKFRPKLFIGIDKFERRLRTISRQGFRVLTLSEAVHDLYSGSLSPSSIVITVDDGFESFYRLAVPCLQRYGYPATVYVTTYYVDNSNPIFRLVVQYMFWKSRKRKLVLRDVAWSANRVVDLTRPAEMEQAMWDCINYGERRCSEVERCRICEQLGDMLEVSYAEIARGRILNLMTPDQLRSLASAQIGVELHTHRHFFPDDDREVAEREIIENRLALQKWLAGNQEHFCYPSGLWSEQQWEWLDDMGIKSSTTCVAGLNSRKTPRHALKRFLDGENIHQLEFEAAVSGFSDLLRGGRAALHGASRI